MSKLFFIACVSMLFVIAACNSDSGNDGYVKWADVVESKTTMFQLEGWEDEYWKSISVNVDKDKIYFTILNAVLEGKLQAFDIVTNDPLSIDDVTAKLANLQLLDSGEVQSQEITVDDLSVIRTREDWYFDEKNYKMKKQVSRIDLLLKKLDNEGSYMGDKALFYVNLNK